MAFESHHVFVFWISQFRCAVPFSSEDARWGTHQHQLWSMFYTNAFQLSRVSEFWTSMKDSCFGVVVSLSVFRTIVIAFVQFQLGLQLKSVNIEISCDCKHRLDVRSTCDPTRHPITVLIESNGVACRKPHNTWPVCVWSLFCFTGIVNTLVNSALHSCFFLHCSSTLLLFTFLPCTTPVICMH